MRVSRLLLLAISTILRAATAGAATPVRSDSTAHAATRAARPLRAESKPAARSWSRGGNERLADVVARAGGAPAEASYILVNLRERALWYVVNGEIRFSAKVAVGRGTPDDTTARARAFATPRGRMVVTRRDSMPLWQPPEWHYGEVARKTGRGLRTLAAGDSILAADGSVVLVSGKDVVRRDPATGVVARVSVAPGKELFVDGRIVVPPLGTTLRQYPAVLGPRRLYLVDGFGLHGTTDPGSIGKAATHGCIRLTNDAITALYEMVPVGTPVYLR